MNELSVKEIAFACGFTDENWDTPRAYRTVMRTLMASVSSLAIFPIQDVLGYGADTRMNIPGLPEGNWRYRVTKAQLDTIDKGYFRQLNHLYGR